MRLFGKVNSSGDFKVDDVGGGVGFAVEQIKSLKTSSSSSSSPPSVGDLSTFLNRKII